MRRVIKLGGSLLVREDLLVRLPQRLNQSDRIERSNRDAHAAQETLVLVGGGALVDAIRAIDRVRPGDPARTHWMCVELMRVTMQVVHDWFPHWNAIKSASVFRDGLSDGFDTSVPNLVDVSSFYNPDTVSELPTDWRTTSDAIAAQLAIETDADELLILKSCDVESSATVEELSAAGIVDAALPEITSRLRGLSIERF